MKLLKFILQHKWQLLSLAAVIIFQGKIVVWITEYICPLTRYVEKDSWVVLFTILATVMILYAISYRRIMDEREKLVSRYWTIIWLLLVYLFFRIDDYFEYYGIGNSH